MEFSEGGVNLETKWNFSLSYFSRTARKWEICESFVVGDVDDEDEVAENDVDDDDNVVDADFEEKN